MAAIGAAGANNPCYAHAMVWIIISIIALITAFLAIYAIIVVFLFKKLLRPRQGVTARRTRWAVGRSGLGQRLGAHELTPTRRAGRIGLCGREPC